MSLFMRNNKWVVQWRENGRTLTQTMGTNKTVATRLLNHKKERAALVKHGLIDPADERRAGMAAKSITEHVQEFSAFHGSRSASKKQTLQVIARITRVCTAGNIRTTLDVSESNVIGAIASMRKTGYRIGKAHRQFSAETLNQHIKAMRQFAKWMYNDGRIRANPLQLIPLFNVARDRRHDRRALTDEEVSRLLDPANLYQTRTMVCSISPADRAVLYRLALATGLRCRELASLTVKSFNLDEAMVTVEAGFSKRGRRDQQPLPPGVVEVLRPWLESKKQWMGPLFHMPANMAKVLRRDLQAANIPYIKDGLYADFHSLRHTFITRLVKANLPPKVAQMLARHSSIELTMNRYTHISQSELVSQLAKVPPLPTVSLIN